MESIVNKIQEYALEEIMGLRYGAYAKEIIQDRAIPDVRDGLKPVQRRILYDMYINRNTSDKPFMKCAKTVGDVLGKFHPHGDSSVYDAMVRMSQWWKQTHVLIDMHGNNGSMDGDGAAAYRYTEARLSKISNELLKDIDKDTVNWALNFDDTIPEPTVLPTKFPVLLVNGCNGISAGYATNIPPHNLGEIIDATIKRIDSPNCRLETILDIVKGPDFPTGGIVEGKQGIIDAFTSGKGRVIVKCKYEFVKNKAKEQIIITEVPFEVNKAQMVQKIDSIRIDKKIEGIQEVRDESDREGLRIAIDLKSGADKDTIVNYLLKNTEMQVSYNYNMVAIVNRRPMTLGIMPLLDAYIAHQKEVITRRSKFDLAQYKKRLNIVDGLLKMISILDDVIKTIRASKNKSDAKNNLVEKFDFNEEQAEAIVMMQLYKLTNTDVVELQEEHDNLLKFIEALELILSDEEKLKDVMKHELKKVKSEYSLPRKTEIRDEITEIKIDELAMVNKDDFVVSISKSGYVKKINLKSYKASENESVGLKDNDYIEGMYKINNLSTILLFTNIGNYIYLPVRDIPEHKYKDIGTHISSIIGISDSEKIIKSIGVNEFSEDKLLTVFTKSGMVKRMSLSLFPVSRYSKPMCMFKLKENDEVVDVTDINSLETIIITKDGMVLKFNNEEIPSVGLKTSGVIGIKLNQGDYVVSGLNTNEEYLAMFTSEKTAKRIKVSDITKFTRAKKGTSIIKSPKSKSYDVIKVYSSGSKTIFGIITDEIGYLKSSEIQIHDTKSTGSGIVKKKIEDVFKFKKIKDLTIKKEITEETIIPETENVPKVKEFTMSDFIDDFKL